MSSALKRGVLIGLLFVLPLFPLWRAVFQGDAIGPFDQIQMMAPWNGQPTTHPWDVLQADSVLQFYGWRSLVLHSWHQHHVPVWNHFELAGVPLLANSQSAALYPLHIVFGFLGLPTPLAVTLLAYLHLVWASLGAYFLAKKLGADDFGSFLAGAMFGMSAFLVAWTPLASVLETCSWIPWCLVATLTPHTLRRVAGLALTVGMMLLAGHLQFATYGILAVVVLACFASKPTSWQFLATCALGCILGLLISSPQLIPVLAYGRTSARQTSPSLDKYTGYAAGAIPYGLLPTIASSTLQGNPRELIPGQAQLSPEMAKSFLRQDLSGYWPAEQYRGMNFAETAFSPGVVAIVLLCMTPVEIWRKRSRDGAFGLGVLGICGLLLAFGTPLGLILYFGVPGWAATGSPGRAEVLFVLACSILAGVSCAHLTNSDSKPSKAGSIIAALFIAMGLFLNEIHPENALRSSLCLLLGIVVLVAVHWQKVTRKKPVIALAGVATALLATFGLLPTSAGTLPAITPPHGRIAAVNSSWDLLATPRAILPPDTASSMGIHEIGGYDSLISKQTKARLEAIDGTDPAPPANGNMLFVKPQFDPNLLAQAGVTEVWSLAPLPQLSGAVHQKNGYVETDLAGPGIYSTPAGPVDPTEETADSLKFAVTGPGPLIIRENLDHQWHATVDNRPTAIGETDGWPSIDLSPGPHQVNLTAQPIGFEVLCPLSVLTLLFAFAAFIFRPEHGKVDRFD